MRKGDKRTFTEAEIRAMRERHKDANPPKGGLKIKRIELTERQREALTVQCGSLMDAALVSMAAERDDARAAAREYFAELKGSMGEYLFEKHYGNEEAERPWLKEDGD